MASNIKDKLHFISEGNSVVRFHTRPGIGMETDGHHQAEVAMLCEVLTDGYASKQLIMAGLTHDMGEQKASDVSAPAKRALGIGAQLHDMELQACDVYELDYYSELSDYEKGVLKFADMFSGMLYCIRQATLGNRNVNLMWQRWSLYYSEQNFLGYSRAVPDVFEALVEMYNEATTGGPTYDVFTSTGESQR